MDRENLLHYLGALGVKVDPQQSRKDKIVGYCPYARFTHKSGVDKRPSFAAFVNEEGISGFLCMACRKKGTIGYLISSLGQLTGQDYSDLLEEVELSEEAGLSHFPDFEAALRAKGENVKPQPLDEAMYHGIYGNVLESPEATAYVRGRGISEQTINALGMYYDSEERRVLFRVRGRDGHLYGYTGRSICPHEIIKVRDYAGLPKKCFLLGEDKFVRGNPVLVVEGLFGYAHLHEIGANRIFNVCALMGSVLTPEKAETLITFGEPVYLLLDNDDGGELGTFGTGERGDFGAAGMLINHVPVFVPVWPENKFDPDELTFDEVQEMRDNTPPFTPQDLC